MEIREYFCGIAKIVFVCVLDIPDIFFFGGGVGMGWG